MTDSSDSELVTQSLAGNRDAFGWIVARYQSLLCSLAYSATGSLNQSEDLAQETFITAWKQLAELRLASRQPLMSGGYLQPCASVTGHSVSVKLFQK
jgi:DNA-directed RNA polymerase specialized sigma24 family protein